MKLPPSIEALVANYHCRDLPRPLIEMVAHEACRLQREADNKASHKIQMRERTGYIKLIGPLVVPEPDHE